MSKFKILFTKSAHKDIKKLDNITKKRFRSKLIAVSQNPIIYAKKLINHHIGEYRWRIGSYRVIFDLDKKRKQIIILRIRHRREVYN